MNCCDICVDPKCGGKKNCCCESCQQQASCYRYLGLKPTIRITRQCTQSCAHCCFECSPQAAERMTVEVAKKVSLFCAKNNIRRAEVMGGEFFCHPEWQELLHILGDGLRSVRLVTNGDWAGNGGTSSAVIDFLEQHPHFYVGVSKDRWHTNKHVDQACGLLQIAEIPHRIPTAEEVREFGIVPAGRGESEMGLYSMFGNYCAPGERRYNFLIDEVGEIYKCGFGAWSYANVDEYQDGGFAARFQEFNQKFYSIFISNCASCLRASQFGQIKKKLTSAAIES